ncbi:MAG TPA: hypothetical protein VD969_19890 [Symbiobacteriaceae bacterium]|nr:hypothetical protein [Symbiobacteriaceae bacterium]
MKPLYWVLIGIGVVGVGIIKLALFQKWLAARQKKQQDMAE